MNTNKRVVSFALVGALIAAAIIGGVTFLSQQGILGWNTTTSSGLEGTLAAQITDPPNLPAGVTDVYISYTSIEVHVANAGNQSGWYSITSPGEINLTSVMSVRETLGSAQVPAGDFNLVRFDISNAIVTYNGANYTAYVPANKITIPIFGDINVLSGASTGFVIDVSPTVIPYQNGTGIGFVLVPATTSIPIPALNWHHGDEHQGTRDDDSDNYWLHGDEDSFRGNITIESASLNPASFSVVVKNTGITNVTLNAVSILSAQEIGFETTESGSSTVDSGSVEGGQTTFATSTSYGENHMSGLDIDSECMTLASFQVLSNGTLVQPRFQPEMDQIVGLVLQSGQSAKLSFSGQISTIHLDAGLYPITSGQTYRVAVFGQFDTSAFANVTAS